jgi:alkanesulfonate monooxygenase SsuD/methylene tetrahydromethanopterin reductase-like flavin-dependent oxidoreductase (luciferase family)
MEIGALFADLPRAMPGPEQLDLMVRQMEWGQAAGLTSFMLAQHWVYGDITHLQPVPLAARLAAELAPASRLGTAIMIAPVYHPIALAEEAATLDIITGGRFILGVGIGYKSDEIRAMGIDPAERASRMEEILPLLPRLWREDRITHRGRYFSFENVEPHIRPVSPKGPTILVGAKMPAAVERAARLADGWLAPSKIPFDGLEKLSGLFHDTRRKAGRPSGTITMLRQVVVDRSAERALERHLALSKLRLDEYEKRSLDLSATNPAGETRDARQTALLGTPDDIARRARWLRERCGTKTLITRVAWLGMTRDQIRDEYARLKDAVQAIKEI